MTTINISRGLILLAILLMCSRPSFAEYPSNLFSITELHFDAYRQACGLDCILKNRTTKDVIASVSGAMGIHPGYVRLALDVAYPSSEIKGEETRYNLPYPPGYKYCSAKINVVSLMSASSDPDRASLIDATLDFNQNHLHIYTWTGEPRPTEPQSSVEGWLLVTGIKPDYYDEFKNKGVCADSPSSGTRQIMHCRGNPCNPVNDGSSYKAGSSVSELKKPPMGF